MATTTGKLAAVFLILTVLPNTLSQDSLDGDGYGSSFYDGFNFPMKHHEFKISVGAGKEECFFQKMEAGAHLFVSFEVLRGADRNIDMIIKNPNGTQLEKREWTKSGNTYKTINTEGIYGFCLDNRISRFSSKLVYFYLLTYGLDVWKIDEETDEQLDVKFANFTTSLMAVDKAVKGVKQLQALSRQHALADWYLAGNSNSLVQKWSIVMCTVTIIASAIQVVFVRRLFTGKHTSTKPRA